MKRIVSVMLAVGIILANSVVFAKEYSQKFWDVEKDHWAFEYIADLADRGVIDGYDDGSFKPERTVSRAEWAKIMVDAAGVTANDNSVNFNDMSNHWANKYVNAAKNYLTGYTDGSYRPDQACTREDVTVAMVKLKGYDLSDVDYSNLSKFKDKDSISNYAKVYVAVALAKDLISGFEDNTFRGQATLTRAEAATLLYRAFQKGSDNKVTDVATVTTPIPVTKPTATPTPRPTAKPTVIPTEAPKPYIMKKLSSASVANVAYATTYDDDSIYYIDKNDKCIYRVSVPGGKKTRYFDVSELSYQETEQKEVETVETITKTEETGEFETIEQEIEEEVTETVVDEETGEETTVTKLVTKTVATQVPLTKEVTEEVTKTETKEVVVKEYNSYVPTQLYYDKENDRLLLLGYYTSITKAFATPQSVKSLFLYDIADNAQRLLAKEMTGSFSVESHIFYNDRDFSKLTSSSEIYAVLDESRLVMSYINYDGTSAVCGIYDYETNASTYMNIYFSSNDSSSSTSCLKYGSNLYSLYFGLNKYDFNANDYEKLSSISFDSYGMMDEYYYFWKKDSGEIFKISVRDGATTNLDIGTNSDKTEFADMGNMDNINTKFYVVDDNTMVFYDRSMQAFRLLTKNN